MARKRTLTVHVYQASNNKRSLDIEDSSGNTHWTQIYSPTSIRSIVRTYRAAQRFLDTTERQPKPPVSAH